MAFFTGFLPHAADPLIDVSAAHRGGAALERGERMGNGIAAPPPPNNIGPTPWFSGAGLREMTSVQHLTTSNPQPWGIGESESEKRDGWREEWWGEILQGHKQDDSLAFVEFRGVARSAFWVVGSHPGWVCRSAALECFQINTRM